MPRVVATEKSLENTRVVYQGQITHQKIPQVVAAKKLPENPRSLNATMIIPIYIYKDALSEIGRLFLAAWVCKVRFVYYRETQKIIPKESKDMFLAT